jgi:hypothetical protein
MDVHIDVPMVPTSVLTVTADSERLSCGGFSLGETIRFGSLEFITDCFSGLSLSPMGDSSDAVTMGSTHSGPPSPRWTMIGDPIEGSSMASDGGGRIDLPLLRSMARRLSPP